MVIKRKPAFATAAIFLILMTITFALASQLNRQNSYFKNLPNIIGQRHQLEFKKGIENKFLNSKKDFNKSEIKTDFNFVPKIKIHFGISEFIKWYCEKMPLFYEAVAPILEKVQKDLSK